MRITTTLAAAVLAVGTATGALAEKLPLGQISNYLNDLRTAEGTFTQINDDGTIDTGTIRIKRPGKMRFEYNAPNNGLVIVSANAVYIVDKKSNQPPETYPLKRTPLSLILARNVNLSQANMVTGHSFDGTATVVTAQDPKNPEYGNIQMKFTGNPVQLRQWVVNDSGGGQTTVVLGELETGGTIPNRLFNAPQGRSN
ncbi:outer membrane lipoprotein carrier protein LolA [uncultured Tateyamaria sp.]|uniref:LolA family protein n=1 Tax=uncultured Tateyamaria sp. TaxID=455651 RepID=UPI0026089B6D|nr:outer membrane lipoprotein carrier protein LolA [uncultured Tateyamaria sp.]